MAERLLADAKAEAERLRQNRDEVVLAFEAAYKRAEEAEAKLREIAEMHAAAHGVNEGFCIECGNPWPCPTLLVLDEPVAAT